MLHGYCMTIDNIIIRIEQRINSLSLTARNCSILHNTLGIHRMVNCALYIVQVGTGKGESSNIENKNSASISLDESSQ